MFTNPRPVIVMGEKAVCDRLQSSRSTVRRMIDRGEFPGPCRTGSRIWWDREVVEAWLARKKAEAEQLDAERAGDRPPAVAPVGHLELRYAAKDRAEVAARRLSRYGFVCEVRPAGDQYACAIRLERGSVPHTIDMLSICCGDLLRVTSPVLVDAVEQAATP